VSDRRSEGVDPSLAVPVSVLNRLVRERLEASFPLLWVAGEVSNLSHAASGHVYFSLKDTVAQVRCVMFRNRAQLLGWRLENGQHIEARVLVTLYEARGDFQLNIEAARRAGTGNLYEKFLRLKEKLEREGLFANAGKRPLPAFPRRIGIVTSPQAAALRDVLSTLTRRAAQVSVVLYPTPVQGDVAAVQIADSLRIAGERAECDLLIVCRGGGSMEDLWAFNEEVVARAIRFCPLPVLTGIGHETDLTIADFAADQRAPTPTAAAELAAPERAALLTRLAGSEAALRRHLMRTLQQSGQHVDWLARRLQRPADYLARQQEGLCQRQRELAAGLQQAITRAREALAGLTHRLRRVRPTSERQAAHLPTFALRLRSAWCGSMQRRSGELARLTVSLAHLNPGAVLARGYAIVADQDGRVVRDSRTVEPSARITVFFERGRAEASVLAVGGGDGLDLALASIASKSSRN